MIENILPLLGVAVCVFLLAVYWQIMEIRLLKSKSKSYLLYQHQKLITWALTRLMLKHYSPKIKLVVYTLVGILVIGPFTFMQQTRVFDKETPMIIVAYEMMLIAQLAGSLIFFLDVWLQSHIKRLQKERGIKCKHSSNR